MGRGRGVLLRGWRLLGGLSDDVLRSCSEGGFRWGLRMAADRRWWGENWDKRFCFMYFEIGYV